MHRFALTAAAGIAVVAGTAFASPQGLLINTSIILETVDENFATIDQLATHQSEQHALGGEATQLFATNDFSVDVLVTSSVQTIGFERSITIRFETVTGGNIFQEGVESLLLQSDYFSMTFFAFQITDAERASLVNYTQALLDVDGEDQVSAGSQFDGFFGGFGFSDSTLPSGDEFFGIAVRGFEVVMQYEIIPAPGAFALLGLAGLAGTRRRR